MLSLPCGKGSRNVGKKAWGTCMWGSKQTSGPGDRDSGSFPHPSAPWGMWTLLCLPGTLEMIPRSHEMMGLEVQHTMRSCTHRYLFKGRITYKRRHSGGHWVDGSGNHKRFLWAMSLKQQEPQTRPDMVNATTQLIKCPQSTVLSAGDVT